MRVLVECALEEQVAARVARTMALQRMVIELLLAVSVDEPEHVALGSLSEQLDLDVALSKQTAGAQVERHKLGVARDAGVLMRKDRCLPAALLHVRVGEVTAVGDENVHDARRKAAALAMRLADCRARVLADRNDEARVRTRR